MTKDQDNPWKDIIEALFEPFILFVSPEAHSEIDWTKKAKFLDKELRQVAPEFVLKKRLADILASVTLKDKSESWIAVHVEIQSQRDTNFAERMYIYNHRIWERFKKEVFSIAVLTDSSPSWRPNTFSRGRWGLSSNMEFLILKLIDYRKRKGELEKSRNPFAFIVLSYLLTREHSNNNLNSYRIGRELIKGLASRGYPKDMSIGILRFIDAVIKISEEWKERLWQDTEKELGHEHMTHYLPFEIRAMKRGEEIGLEKGEQIGRQQGEQQGRQGAYLKAIKTFLSTRFGRKNAAPAIERLYGIQDTKALESLLELACKAKTVNEVLANYPKVKKSAKARTTRKTSNGPKVKHTGSKLKKLARPKA